jgi:hypothetical protein
MIDGKKETNIKAPNLEKIQNQRTLYMGIPPLVYLDRLSLFNVENIDQTAHYTRRQMHQGHRVRSD